MSKKKTASSRKPKNTSEGFDEAVAALKRGEAIVFPTETLYGLGADALDAAAVDKIFRLKGRDRNHPIPVLIADSAMLELLVAKMPGPAKALMDGFWPGPLTLVLPALKGVPEPLLNPRGGIGVRLSSQAIATDLVRALGRPLTATSANPSGREPARTVEEAKDYFSGSIDIFLDRGPLKSKTGSTVVEILEHGVRIIRQGDVTTSALARAVGRNRILP